MVRDAAALARPGQCPRPRERSETQRPGRRGRTRVCQCFLVVASLRLELASGPSRGLSPYAAGTSAYRGAMSTHGARFDGAAATGYCSTLNAAGRAAHDYLNSAFLAMQGERARAADLADSSRAAPRRGLQALWKRRVRPRRRDLGSEPAEQAYVGRASDRSDVAAGALAGGQDLLQELLKGIQSSKTSA